MFCFFTTTTTITITKNQSHTHIFFITMQQPLVGGKFLHSGLVLGSKKFFTLVPPKPSIPNHHSSTSSPFHLSFSQSFFTPRQFSSSAYCLKKKKSKMPPKKAVEEKKILLGRPGNNLKVYNITFTYTL